MTKKEIKENLKQFHKAVDENNAELQTLDILNPILPQQATLSHGQEYIQRNVNLYTKEKAFNLNLDNGPFKGKYSQNGSHMLIHNNTGYLSAFNVQSFSVCFETNLDDQIYDAIYLHSDQYLATAQKDCVFIYDSTGNELHSVRELKNTKMLEFLPYHFLLVGSTSNGFMNYLDTSIGEVAASIFIGDKNPTVIKSNPSNAVIHLGSKRGQVSLWLPSQKSYAMKINCHRAAVTTIEIDRSGDRMITTGLDNKLKVFDIRNTYEPLKTVPTKTNVHFTALSERNLLAMGYSNKIVVLKDFNQMYLKHNTPSPISSLQFCNHEDILSIGHGDGITSIVVPGSGDPIYDSNEISPFMSKKDRQNLEVRRLLDKIPADMISTKPVLGTFEAKSKNTTPQESKRYFEIEEQPRNALSRFSKRHQ